MAKTNKITKFEIRSSDELTDLTSFVKGMEVKPYHPSLLRRLFNWLWWQWFRHKINRSWRKISRGATIEIEFVKRIREPWRWN